MDGSGIKRKCSRNEQRMIEELGGISAVKAMLRGERPKGLHPDQDERERSFPPPPPNVPKRVTPPEPFDHEVPLNRQMWNKKHFGVISSRAVDLHMKKYYLDRQLLLHDNSITATAEEEEEFEDEDAKVFDNKSVYESRKQEEKVFDDNYEYVYPDIRDFQDKLDESERITSADFKRDLARYNRDKEISDGFDVGHYPYLYAAGICSSNFLFCHYKPPHILLPKPELDTLTRLSELAISVYNMHQLHPTHYDNVQVVKAMKFGPYSGTNLNLTFHASEPPVTFQTRLYDHCCPPYTPYYHFEIVLVRKFTEPGGQEDASLQSLSLQETDYVGVEWLPKFPLSMEKLSDFDEKDPQTYTILTDIQCKFPLYLSQFALHQYNLDQDEEDVDDIYDNAKVLTTLKSLNDDQGTTYFITFEASNRKNTQIFETKLFMSPLLPTTRIKFWFVRIKPN